MNNYNDNDDDNTYDDFIVEILGISSVAIDGHFAKVTFAFQRGTCR